MKSGRTPRLLLLFAAIFFAANLPAFSEAARTVILVRHAERAGGTGADVPLSQAGQCRAGILAGMLSSAGVGRIFTSEVARTQQTAAPLASKLNVKPETVLAKDVDKLVAKLRSGPAAAALVVGHSNTLPDIIQRLGGGTVPPIADDEFDRLFVAMLTGPKQATVVTLRYKGCEP